MTKENRIKENKIKFNKKYVCMLCIFLFALFEPVLLCGCASAQDEVVMTLNNEDAAAPESLDKNMTEVSFSGEVANAETESVN